VTLAASRTILAPTADRALAAQHAASRAAGRSDRPDSNPGVIPQAATMAYGRCASIPQTAAAVAER
jgi:hypothetical protein